MVMRSQAYMAVFDWLALENYKIEEIQSKQIRLKDELLNARNAILDKRSEVYNWLNMTFRKGHDSNV